MSLLLLLASMKHSRWTCVPLIMSVMIRFHLWPRVLMQFAYFVWLALAPAKSAILLGLAGKHMTIAFLEL